MTEDDRRLLRETVRRLLSAHASDQSRDSEASRDFDPDLWQALVEIGLPGMAIDVEHGGAGGSFADLAVAFEELGYGLVPSPLLPTVALAAPLLAESTNVHAVNRWLPGIAAGDVIAAVALPHGIDATVTDGSTLTGTARTVIGAAGADLVLVPVGGKVFAVDLPTAQVTAEPLTALDSSRPVAALCLAGARGVDLQLPGDAVERTWQAARVLLAAEQVGGARWCLDVAVDHARTRTQFGRPIGAFQAVKHLCADSYTEVEGARALVVDALSTGAAREAAMAAAFASEAFIACAERAMQILGGIGYTWEHDCHRYLRRAQASARLLTGRQTGYEQIAQLTVAQA